MRSLILNRAGLSLFLIALACQDSAIPPSPLAQSRATPPAKELQEPSREWRPASTTDDLFTEAHRYLDVRNLEEARTRFELALKLSGQKGDLHGQAQAHSGLAQVSWARGDLQGALTSFQAALDIWQQPGMGDPVLQAEALVSRGEVFLAVGKPHDAIGSFNEARKLLRPEGNQRLRFAIASGVGMAYFDLDLPSRAAFAYQQALNVAPSFEDKAIVYHRLGTAHSILDNRPEAAKALGSALEFARRAKDPWVEAYALADLAHLSDLEGREEEALAGFAQARNLFEDLENNLYVASTLLGTAEAQRDLGRLDDAIASIERSIQLVERIRSDLNETGDRVGFFSTRHRYYDLYIELLMAQARRKPGAGYGVQAFEASEQSKARSLLDDMAGESGLATQGMKLKDIQRELLDEDSLLLAYSLGNQGSFLWIVGPATISVHPLPKRTDLEDAAFRAWSELAERKGTSAVESLSRMLLPAGIGSLAGKRLLVSLDGLLHLIPFTLLRGDGDRMLFLDHEITHIPSASVVVGMRRKLESRLFAPKKFAGLGDAVFQMTDTRLSGLGEPTDFSDRGTMEELIGRLERLKFSDDEVESILRLFPDKEETFAVFGFDANRELALNPMLARFQILHFATHHVAGEHPDFTGLVLSLFDENGRPRQGFVTAPEIYNLNLPAELVVLSACGTGLGKDVRGEGPVGLTRAFLHAGARRVVVSLWSVKDETTAELMRRFYREMLEGKLHPAAALRAAQISMYEERRWRSSYRSWGAFVLQGEPR